MMERWLIHGLPWVRVHKSASTFILAEALVLVAFLSLFKPLPSSSRTVVLLVPVVLLWKEFVWRRKLFLVPMLSSRCPRRLLMLQVRSLLNTRDMCLRALSLFQALIPRSLLREITRFHAH